MRVDTPMRTMKMVQNLKRNLFFVWKMTRIWWNSIWALKSKKIALWLIPFVQSIQRLTLKSTKEYISWHEESCKIRRKTDLWFGKWHEEFSEFSSEHLKMSKLIFSWGPFVQSRKWMSYNYMSYRGVMSNDTEEWWKIWGEIDL